MKYYKFQLIYVIFFFLFVFSQLKLIPIEFLQNKSKLKLKGQKKN